MAGAAIPPARAAALFALSQTLPSGRGEPGYDAQAALDHVLTSRSLSPQDQGLCTELFYGYLRLKGRIDFILSQFLKKPGDLPVPVRLTAGVATYEILYLSRIPPRASVNWAVEHVGKSYGRGLSGLVNAVLRRVSDNARLFSDKSYYDKGGCDRTTFLSRYYSCPEWIVALWQKTYGEEDCEVFLAAQATAPPVGVRVNFARPGAEALFDRLRKKPECLFYHPPMLAFSRPPENFDLGAAEESGEISRQSAAAGEALGRLAPESWPTPIYDACSGRGGKTMFLLERFKSEVWAGDVHFGRLRALKRERERLGLPELPVILASAEAPPLGRAPGTILLDAPCSGLGVLSRRPDAKWKRDRRHLAELSVLQGRMLSACYASLAPGGLLVYLTCTLNPAENENAVAAFLAATPGAVLQTVHNPGSGAETDLGEYFYAAVIRKA